MKIVLAIAVIGLALLGGLVWALILLRELLVIMRDLEGEIDDLL